jgi:hypothetical protein
MQLKSQHELGEKCSSRLSGRVIEVCFLILKLAVKEISRSDGEKAVPLRQTVIDCGVDYPKVTCPRLTAGRPSSLEFTVLIEVARF